MKQRSIFRLAAAAVAAVLLAVGVSAADADGAGQRIVQGTLAEEETIDLQEYGIHREEIGTLYTDLYNSGDLPWYMMLQWSFTYGSDDLVRELTPQYLDPVEYDRGLYEQTVAEILAQTVHPGMTEVQIALSIHDYLAANCVYDETLTHKTGYDALVRGTAVCQGYAEAYMDLLERCGIDCAIADSEAMNHSWNLVNIGGQWYHVDVTWDDPSQDVAGRVMHDYFLLSDEAMGDGDHGHYGWESTVTCTDRSFETNRFWLDLDSAVWYEDASVCYLRRRDDSGYRILRRDETAGTETELYGYDMKYPDIGSGRVHLCNYGLTMEGDGLYFTDVDQIYRLDLASGQTDVVWEYDVEANQRVLLGSFLREGTLYLTTTDAAGDQEAAQAVIADTPAHVHEYAASVVAPTCASEGYTEYVCACGVCYSADVTPATGAHRYDENGQCSVCGAVKAAEPETTEADVPVWSREPGEPEEEPGILGWLLDLWDSLRQWLADLLDN